MAIRKFSTKGLKFPKDEEFRLDNWKYGLNTLMSPTKIKDEELSEAENIELDEIGQITKRRGRAYYGNEKNSRVMGLAGYYKTDGTNKLVQKSNTAVCVYNTATSDWDAVSGHSYTDGYAVNFAQVYDRLYIASGQDSLAYYDGSTLTVFNSASAPTSVAVSAVGAGAGTGNATYAYRIDSETDVGKTVATTSVSANSLPDTLSTTATCVVTWNSATESSVNGYNIYGRKWGKEMWLKFVEGAGSQTWTDDGAYDESTVFTPTTSDTTKGPKGEIITVYKDTLFIAGDPDEPSLLYYSAGGDKINSFSINDGGGFIYIQRDDGDEITGMKVFQDSLVVFKRRSIHKFTFSTSGLPQVEVVNQSVGAVSFRSIQAVENDVFFLSERGVFVLGNEPNYLNVIRTNELSARIRPKMNLVNQEYAQNSAAIYHDNLYILSVPTGSSATNNKTYIYDRERLAWYEWNFGANCWLVYYDSDKEIHLLYGEEASGYTTEMTGSTDFGSGFTTTVKTKQVDLDRFELYKRFKNLVFHFRNISGSLSVKIWVDGTTVTKTFSLNRSNDYIGWGYDRWANFLWGSTAGSSATASEIDIVRRLKRLSGSYRTIAFEIEHSVAGNFHLLNISGKARPKSENFYPSSESIS